MRPQSGPPRPTTGETRTSTTMAHLSVNIYRKQDEIPEVQVREVPATEPFEPVLAAHSNGGLSVPQLERDDHGAQSRHTQAEWNKLRAILPRPSNRWNTGARLPSIAGPGCSNDKTGRQATPPAVRDSPSRAHHVRSPGTRSGKQSAT